MKTKVSRWGNSFAVRLPKSAVERLGLKNGTPLELSAEDGRLLLIPQHASDPELAKLIARITPKNRHGETGWGLPVGHETW